MTTDIDGFNDDDLPPAPAEVTLTAENDPLPFTPPQPDGRGAGTGLDALISEHPETEAAALRIAAKYRLDPQDPGWDLAHLVADAAGMAEQAQQALERSTDILRASAEAVDKSRAAIPDAIRSGAVRAGDDIRGQMALAANDAASTVKSQVESAISSAAPVAARQILRAVAPGIRDASLSAVRGGKSRWMVTAITILLIGLLAGGGGVYYTARKLGRITPSYLTVNRTSEGWDIWTGAPGAALPGGRDGCPRGVWQCTSRYRVRR